MKLGDNVGRIFPLWRVYLTDLLSKRQLYPLTVMKAPMDQDSIPGVKGGNTPSSGGRRLKCFRSVERYRNSLARAKDSPGHARIPTPNGSNLFEEMESLHKHFTH